MINLNLWYQNLPLFLQNFICSLEGFRIQLSRYGRPFSNLYAECANRTFWPEERIIEFRDWRLRQFIQYSYDTVPYYRQLFKKNGILPSDIKGLNDLKYLPVLSKDEVQRHLADLVSTGVSKEKQCMVHTSGTTGGGLRFPSTRQALQEQWAIWWRYRKWHGLDFNRWCGYFAGRSVVPLLQKRPPFWRYNIPGKQILFSGYHMSPATLGAYIEELARRKVEWLHGYPSLLALLAAFIIDNKINLGYPVKWITIGAENLMPHQVELIEKAFKVRPRQHYGMAEAVANISECENGFLHVDEDFSAVEFVPNVDGSNCKVIGTNFSNPAFPLIRYDVADMVVLSGQKCGCGRPGRVVKYIDGRCEDYVILTNGARLGRLDHILKDMVNIREAQIFQKQIGKIIFRIVRGSAYLPADEQQLLLEARQRVGNDTQILIEYVETLPRSKNGKLRFVVSELADGKI